MSSVLYRAHVIYVLFFLIECNDIKVIFTIISKTIHQCTMLNQRIETNDFKNDIMKSKSLLCLLVLTFLAFQLPAQELTLFGELRPRGEYRDGYAKPIITSNRGGFFIKQRTRSGANFPNWLLTMEVTFQNSRVWSVSADDTDNLSI